jgi:uncharacterized protein
MSNQVLKITRPILFCLLCAITLATISGLTKSLSSQWKDHLMLIITVAITYCFTMLFAKWEKLPLKSVGVVPNRSTTKKLVIGFGIGILMALLHAIFVAGLGHYTMSFGSGSVFALFFYLLLYILVALREELAFRGYPLFSLNYSFGFWMAQLIIFLIFSLEHVAGGMTWGSAFLGAGTGALLFGFAAIKTNGIAVPIGLHTAWNFGEWCFGFKKEPGLFVGVAEKGFDNIVERNSWIGYLIVMVIFITVFYFYKGKHNNDTGNKPAGD